MRKLTIFGDTACNSKIRKNNKFNQIKLFVLNRIEQMFLCGMGGGIILQAWKSKSTTNRVSSTKLLYCKNWVHMRSYRVTQQKKLFFQEIWTTALSQRDWKKLSFTKICNLFSEKFPNHWGEFFWKKSYKLTIGTSSFCRNVFPEEWYEKKNAFLYPKNEVHSRKSWFFSQSSFFNKYLQILKSIFIWVG